MMKKPKLMVFGNKDEKWFISMDVSKIVEQFTYRVQLSSLLSSFWICSGKKPTNCKKKNKQTNKVNLKKKSELYDMKILTFMITHPHSLQERKKITLNFK